MAGIPRQVDDKNLEKKVLSIFQKIGCAIYPTFIDDCHQLSKNNDSVIAKFTRRKDCKEILKVKKDLRVLNMDDLYLPRGKKNRILWLKPKKLQNIGSINNFYIPSRPITIKHLIDFKIYFPDIDLSPPIDAL